MAGRREHVGAETEAVVVEVVVIDVRGTTVGARVAREVVVGVAEADLLAVPEHRIETRVTTCARLRPRPRI